MALVLHGQVEDVLGERLFQLGPKSDEVTNRLLIAGLAGACLANLVGKSEAEGEPEGARLL